MTQRMVRLFRDPCLRRALAAGARRTAETRSWRVELDRLEESYRERWHRRTAGGAGARLMAEPEAAAAINHIWRFRFLSYPSERGADCDEDQAPRAGLQRLVVPAHPEAARGDHHVIQDTEVPLVDVAQRRAREEATVVHTRDSS